ncbi:MAG: Phospho-N-acetylmuramoyl-pentapeptide-transferase [Parcubacteria group bacterium GW2011_GWA2_43_17]|nr:MAG: Phospho-N-acetylmuramoyl-pentapeptide-transferase [Parcubacteria group bacterium GW2011_GWA2_43_17]KKT94467.1 MAG: Phospho-N-acetylmuramoyl-pentapeptide-transferase [Parcubacteria group bacterium GW2011_GWF2_45_11]KKT96875.1 MAG: Phospho-N-acetylmuramoyl-pentapeptide-transferase [Parcubacteria group bacterium GW2011_GWC2_45_15]OGY92583.1 MAG: phospho-N-acetylmuramoyl-pentapeptide-transferase [Candidatus Komeilibacteria bacterium RIFOXYA2_FULL_45_9]OGY93791.1 MAG: phospho-N-acetylmuramoy
MIANFAIIKIFLLTTAAFVLAIALTPWLTHYLYKYKAGKQIRSSEMAPIYFQLHQKKAGTPTMGGIIIWLTVLLIAVILFYLDQLTSLTIFHNLNFLTRSQTLLPLGALVASAIIGLVDDWLGLKKAGRRGQGLGVRHKLLIYTAIAAVGSWWFYFKLDWDLLHIPFLGNFEIGWWYIPIFIFIIVATSFSVNETDGLDGLAGGVLLTSFGSLAAIAFILGKYDLATFCGVIIGALLAFLWFNINPARFIMGDTGSMSLGVTLGIVAMLTNTALLLPLISIVLVIESLSVIVQLISKKLRHGKKVFLSAPIHHHLEAKGWPEPKIVMRFWVISGVSATIGLIIFLLDKV